MGLEQYKHDIAHSLLEATLMLTDAEYEELIAWLREEGLV